MSFFLCHLINLESEIGLACIEFSKQGDLIHNTIEAPLITKLKVLNLCMERIDKNFNSLINNCDEAYLGERLQALRINDWISESSK